MPHSPELDHLAARWTEAPDGTTCAALVDGLRKCGALAEAEAVAMAGLTRHPELVTGLLALARLRQAQGDLAAAEATLHRALGRDPSHPVVLEALAEIAAAAGHPEAARAWAAVAEAAGEAKSTGPTAAESGAEPTLDDAAWLDAPAWSDDDPPDPEATELVTESLAKLLQHQGHLERAAAAFRTLAERHPDHPDYPARIEALEHELKARRPRSYDAVISGGTPLGDWLARVAAATPAPPHGEQGFDAFYQPVKPAERDTSDFSAFQEWLRGLGR